MMESDFSYSIPDSFENRVAQLFIQKNREDLKDAFQNCSYSFELLNFAYYEGISGDNWNKRAIDFTIEGPYNDIELLKSSKTLCNNVIEIALQPNKSGLLIKNLYFFELQVKSTTEDLFHEEIDLNNCERIGCGGYGDVYKYCNKHLEMDFALKVYHPIYNSETDQYDGERRFFREAKMLFSLIHEGIVRVYDAGRIEDGPYIKMEYVNGSTLTAFHDNKGNLSFQDSLPIIKKVLSAIGYAHKNGVLHRDLKPENILIEREGQRIVVIDFGISAFFDTGRHTQLTKVGVAIAGSSYTDPYLIKYPELRDPRSDIYSIGAIWFYLLCGRSPGGSDIEEVLRLSQKDITDKQVEIIMKCMKNDPEDRYKNCEELLSILDPTLQDTDSHIQSISGLCSNSITDDEKVVLFYILEKKKRKVTRNEIQMWLYENEIYGIDIDNAFDLLSTIGGGSIIKNGQMQSLEIGIGLFRECVSNDVRYKELLKESVESHIIIAADTFLGKCKYFDTIDWLFVSYIVDRQMYSFGDRWMSKMQIEDIIQWESANNIDCSLSDNYGRCLESFKQNNLVYESDWTSEGNPRAYTLCESLKTLLNNRNEYIIHHMRDAKDSHCADIPF